MRDEINTLVHDSITKFMSLRTFHLLSVSLKQLLGYLLFLFDLLEECTIKFYYVKEFNVSVTIILCKCLACFSNNIPF